MPKLASIGRQAAPQVAWIRPYSPEIAALFAEGALGVARIGTRLNGRMTWRYAFNARAPMLPGFGRQRGFVL